MLVEIHVLQNHAPANLNRDDTGSPKECVFGGVKRARISSQCLKRSIRTSEIFQNELHGNIGHRTRKLPAMVKEKLLQRGYSEEIAEIGAIKASGFGTSDGKEKEDKQTAQIMFLNEADIEAITNIIDDAFKACEGDLKKINKVSAKDLQSDKTLSEYRPVSIDMALFGRMTTSNAFQDVQAACQVAHALSTNKIDHEYDYFTAVDDLMSHSDDELGAGMIGDVEYNSACFYKYFSVDVDSLIGNLTGENMGKNANPSDEDIDKAKELALRSIKAFIKSAIFTTPTGKQNSFASHTLPSAVLIELRPVKTPVSYANAFVNPIRSNNKEDLVTLSVNNFVKHVDALTSGFGLESSARYFYTPEHKDIFLKGVDQSSSLPELLDSMVEILDKEIEHAR